MLIRVIFTLHNVYSTPSHPVRRQNSCLPSGVVSTPSPETARLDCQLLIVIDTIQGGITIHNWYYRPTLGILWANSLYPPLQPGTPFYIRVYQTSGDPEIAWDTDGHAPLARPPAPSGGDTVGTPTPKIHHYYHKLLPTGKQQNRTYLHIKCI